MSRRDGRYWGFVITGGCTCHLWRPDPDRTGYVLAECGRSAVPSIAIHDPVYTLADGRPPTHDRCRDCDVADRERKRRKREVGD